ncbi:hypothetical protein GCM10009557_17370 [Virgisporangium ochraceum]|uniref:Uncharacterized protein n=1 Tax=Virgisporangium ochraceum TaxID=65505 RepID=A0A8J4EAB7_9ACTN|nr:hypothetical protein [Virgisporangium ochraceum]GIJ67243.1 hypothetical protein Voc01_021600 [Virgisporangium ochraceum]
MDETLGLLGHPGGILVDHPRLRVGLVAAVSRPDSLELDLIGRSPRNPTSMTDPPAPRVLLPRYEEGMDLRVARLDADGRPQWMYGDTETGTGTPIDVTVVRTRLRLPPTFDSARIVLAWPEIGFPEAVVTLALPDREAVARAATSVWTAPVDHRPPPPATAGATASMPPLDVEPEAGLVLTGQRVLHRGDDAVVVLAWLSSVGQALALEVRSFARGRRGGAATMAAMYGPGRRTGSDGPRDHPAGASIALLHGDGTSWPTMTSGTTSGGDDVFDGRAEYALDRPDSDVLDLVVGWPEADLPDAHVRLPVFS